QAEPTSKSSALQRMRRIVSSGGRACASSARSTRDGLRHRRRNGIEAVLEQLQAAVVVLPEVVLQRSVEERNAIQRAVAVDIGIEVKQLLRHVGEGGFSLGAHLHRGVDAAKGLAGRRIAGAGGG